MREGGSVISVTRPGRTGHNQPKVKICNLRRKSEGRQVVREGGEGVGKQFLIQPGL